jgi:hypothetical protein
MNTATAYGVLSLEELTEAHTGFKLAALNMGAVLCDRAGSFESAALEVRRAFLLPPSVLARRAKEAEGIVIRNGVPTTPQLAAFVARIIATVNAISASIERKQAGASLQ